MLKRVVKVTGYVLIIGSLIAVAGLATNIEEGGSWVGNVGAMLVAIVVLVLGIAMINVGKEDNTPDG
jgi:uncharacterized membrane protein YfbV (UPF0208 family)